MSRFFRLLSSALVLALLAGAAAVRAQDRPARGGITGSVTDKSTGLPLFGVEVSVEEQPYRASTDLGGRFTVGDLPPGEHTVVFRLDRFATTRVAHVVVQAGENATVETPMEPLGGPEVQVLDEMTVTSEAAKAGSRTAGIEERRNVAVAMEVIGKEELGKLAVSDVAEAMVRMPGVSVASKGSFVVIRGLAERYNSASFNGTVVPSSDPERQSVELDQIPTRLIESLAVYKNFAPDLPGNLSGGGVDVRTVAFPAKRFLSVTAGVSADGARFEGGDYLTYATARAGDAWGRGSRGRLELDALLDFAADNPHGSFPADPATPFAASRHAMPFGKKFGAFYGRTFSFGDNRRLGVSVGLSYDSSYSSEEGGVQDLGAAVSATLAPDGGYRLKYNYRDKDGRPLPFNGYQYLRSKEKVQLGALGTVAFRFNAEHQLQFTAFSSQTGNDTAQYDHDYVRLTSLPYTREALALLNPAPNTEDVIERWRYQLHYRERNLTHLALGGSHVFPALRDAKLSWSAGRSSTYQDEPDRRKYRYDRLYREVQYESPSIERSWRKVEETQDNLQLALRLPFRVWQRGEAAFELGGAVTKTDRTYTEGIPEVNVGGVILENPADIAPYVRVFPDETPTEVGLKRTLGAAYTKLDLPIVSWMKLSGGVRWELTEVRGSGFGVFPSSPALATFLLYTAGENFRYRFWQYPWEDGGHDSPKNRELASANLKQWDPLPAVNLTLTPTRALTVRLSYTHTLARPSVREMSNYISQDDQERDQHGNALLRLSAVRNYDLRFEYFMDGTDLAAVTFFYKTIREPIEKAVITPPVGEAPAIDMWFNNPGTATVRGAEFEVRKGLGFLGSWFESWSLGGNATKIEAEAPVMSWTTSDGSGTYREKPAGFPETRRLYDQPRWLANGDLTWESKRWGTAATVSAFASDSVLLQVVLDGTNLDRYQAGFTRWDFTLRQKFGRHWSVKLSGKNLADPARKIVRDPSVLAGTGVELVDRTWHDGRSFTLTTTYDF